MGIFNRKKKKKTGTSNKRIAYTPPTTTINSPGPKELPKIGKTKPMWQKAIDAMGDSASVWNISDTPSDTSVVRDYYLKSKGKKKRGGTFNQHD